MNRGHIHSAITRRAGASCAAKYGAKFSTESMIAAPGQFARAAHRSARA